MINVAINDDIKEDADALKNALKAIEVDYNVIFNNFFFESGESF